MVLGVSSRLCALVVSVFQLRPRRREETGTAKVAAAPSLSRLSGGATGRRNAQRPADAVEQQFLECRILEIIRMSERSVEDAGLSAARCIRPGHGLRFL